MQMLPFADFDPSRINVKAENAYVTKVGAGSFSAVEFLYDYTGNKPTKFDKLKVVFPDMISTDAISAESHTDSGPGSSAPNNLLRSKFMFANPDGTPIPKVREFVDPVNGFFAKLNSTIPLILRNLSKDKQGAFSGLTGRTKEKELMGKVSKKIYFPKKTIEELDENGKVVEDQNGHPSTVEVEDTSREPVMYIRLQDFKKSEKIKTDYQTVFNLPPSSKIGNRSLTWTEINNLAANSKFICFTPLMAISNVKFLSTGKISILVSLNKANVFDIREKIFHDAMLDHFKGRDTGNLESQLGQSTPAAAITVTPAAAEDSVPPKSPEGEEHGSESVPSAVTLEVVEDPSEPPASL